LRSRIETNVDATGERIFDLARDVTKWPMLLPHYQKVTVMSRDGDRLVAMMRAVRRFGPFRIPVGWRSRTWAEPGDPNDLRLRFEHVAGPTRGMDVTWHITPTADGGASIAIVHDFSRRLPVLGSEIFPAIVDRLFVRPIAGETLATFKRLAESRDQS
jgi:ribosome-associated toxin RatA of RatAB toxin-antitoxin module